MVIKKGDKIAFFFVFVQILVNKNLTQTNLLNHSSNSAKPLLENEHFSITVHYLNSFFNN